MNYVHIFIITKKYDETVKIKYIINIDEDEGQNIFLISHQLHYFLDMQTKEKHLTDFPTLKI